MNEIQLKSYAKINLCLNILKRLPNNYHEISSLIQRIDLFDEISVKKTDRIIKVKTDNDNLNQEINTNTAYLASKYFFDFVKIDAGTEILIKKNIPHAAGLGGSSGNAAEVINALDILYETNLAEIEKFALGYKVGCDVGFFFNGGTAVVEGTGDKIIHKNQLENYYVIIIMPEFGICTKTAYASVDPMKLNNKSNAELLYSAYNIRNIEEIKKYTINSFEDFIEKKTKIKKIKRDLLNAGAITSLLTGSGSCVFGIFESDNECADAFYSLNNKYKSIFKCKFF